MFDNLDLTYTADDVTCAHCGKAIPHNTQGFRRGQTWLCSMACVEQSKPASAIAKPQKGNADAT